MKKAILIITVGAAILLTVAGLTVGGVLDSETPIIAKLALWLIGAMIFLLGFTALFSGPRKFMQKVRARLTRSRHPAPSSHSATQRSAHFERSMNGSLRLLRSTLEDLATAIPTLEQIHHYQPIPHRVAFVGRQDNFLHLKGIFADLVFINQPEPQANSDEPSQPTINIPRDVDALWILIDGVDAPPPNLDFISRVATEAKAMELPVIAQLDTDSENLASLDFLNTADTVFTSDSDSIPTLKDMLGHEAVHFGEIGANPLVYNPLGSQRYNLPQAFFSGTYPLQYGERTRDMKVIFDGFLPSESLIIADESNSNRELQFPARYDAVKIPSIKPELLPAVHKLFTYTISFESIKDNATQYATRAVKMQALGKPLISNYSVALFNKFPLVKMLPEKGDFSRLFSQVALDDAQLLAHLALNEVMEAHNSFESFSAMAKYAGLQPAPKRSSRVLVVAEGHLEKVKADFAKQTYQDAELVRASELAGIDLNNYGYIACMSDELDYEPNYLRGRVNAFRYSNASFVTQTATFSDAESNPTVHEYIQDTYRRALTMVSTSVPEALDFMAGTTASITGLGYAVPPFDVNLQSYLEQLHSTAGRDPRLSVIVPVYNNGAFLKAKAIPSLRLNKIFDRMEILLVDDGSTDPETKRICTELADINPNIVYFAFDDGGSGSASRPRNWGIEHARGELITFLDPDNEISIGGYDTLVEHFDRENSIRPIDFVSGFQAKTATRRAYTGRHVSGDPEVVTDFHDFFFSKGTFPVISTQAAVITKDLLDRANLRFIERAVGQDTLFGWEVVLEARAGVFVDDVFLIYYAERADSVTNVVGAKYFARVLINERAKRDVLERHGILETYKNTHMPKFIRTWYLPRLERVPADQRAAARTDLEEIVRIYGHELAEYEADEA